jgi:hypothetical protein
MGIYDDTSETLECPNCTTTETLIARDYGNHWSGSYWHMFGKSLKFEIETTGGEKVMPSIVSAKCKGCGTVVSVN